ncbi:uracil-xanthine permease family protein [Paenibacillus nasutitermitis]|uniref:Uracil permease n=1 Tax=Paenibacillus nasutitermitis TaxID=1652958 RepID=A0A916YPH3_9BACL|nr:solute carrier family 23 protein [Paenibacillus nasutitermitis]GGD55517.1 uracil permease [Paenibacillus nasutitermitis]
MHEQEKANVLPDQDPVYLTVGVEEKLPVHKTVLYGLQHVFVSNVWLDPVFVAALIGLPMALAANMVNAIFIAAGLVTLVQATRLVKLPVVQGPSAAFDSLLISSGKDNGLAAAGGGIVLSGLIVFALAVTGVLGRLKSIFTPVVSGAVILVVGIALSGFTLYEFLGGSPDMDTFATVPVLTMSVTTALVVILLSVFAKGLLRSFAFLIALVVGDLIAFGWGKLDFSSVAEKSWLGMPHFLPYGSLTFDWPTFAVFFFAYMVAVIEAMGVYHAASDMVRVPLTAKQIRYGFSGEAAGSIASTLIGGFPTTAYAQNVGLLRLTGMGSRHAVTAAGVIFLILGFVPKAGALLVVTPGAVVGGLFLPAAASLIYSGVGILGRMAKTEANFAIAGLSILLAISLPPIFEGAAGFAGKFLSNTIMVGALTAIVLQLALVNIPGWLRMLRPKPREASS